MSSKENNKKVGKTYQQVFTFFSEAGAFIESVGQTEMVFVRALEKMIGSKKNRTVGRLSDFYTEYNEKIEDYRIDHCEKNDKKHILRDEFNNRVWTVEGERKLNKAIKSLNKLEVEFYPYYVKADDVPADLLQSQKEIFMGFVIEPIEEKADPTEEVTNPPSAESAPFQSNTPSTEPTQAN